MILISQMNFFFWIQAGAICGGFWAGVFSSCTFGLYMYKEQHLTEGIYLKLAWIRNLVFFCIGFAL